MCRSERLHQKFIQFGFVYLWKLFYFDLLCLYIFSINIFLRRSFFSCKKIKMWFFLKVLFRTKRVWRTFYYCNENRKKKANSFRLDFYRKSEIFLFIGVVRRTSRCWINVYSHWMESIFFWHMSWPIFIYRQSNISKWIPKMHRFCNSICNEEFFDKGLKNIWENGLTT